MWILGILVSPREAKNKAHVMEVGRAKAEGRFLPFHTSPSTHTGSLPRHTLLAWDLELRLPYLPPTISDGGPWLGEFG